VRRLLRKLRWRIGSLDRAPYATEEGQPVENLDATAAAAMQHQSDALGVGGYPPGYVKSYDEGRPRH
jgi:hypothetical protein